MTETVASKISTLNLNSESSVSSETANGQVIVSATNGQAGGNPWKSRKSTEFSAALAVTETKESSKDVVAETVYSESDWPSVSANNLEQRSSSTMPRFDDKQKNKKVQWKSVPYESSSCRNQNPNLKNNNNPMPRFPLAPNVRNARPRRGTGNAYASRPRIMDNTASSNNNNNNNKIRPSNPGTFVRPVRPRQPDQVSDIGNHHQPSAGQQSSPELHRESPPSDVNTKKALEDAADKSSQNDRRTQPIATQAQQDQNVATKTNEVAVAAATIIPAALMPLTYIAPVATPAYIAAASVSQQPTAVAAAAAAATITSEHILVSPITPSGPAAVALPLPPQQQQQLSVPEVVDLSHVIELIKRYGWEKTVLPPSMYEMPEIQAITSGGALKAPSATDKAAPPQNNVDIVIINDEFYFVPRNVHRMKFLKFSSKCDYIVHHLGYYFCENNLQKDKHLNQIMTEHKNTCPVRDLLQFNRLRVTNTTEQELISALKRTPSVFLDRSEVDGQPVVVVAPSSTKLIEEQQPQNAIEVMAVAEDLSVQLPAVATAAPQMMVHLLPANTGPSAAFTPNPQANVFMQQQQQQQQQQLFAAAAAGQAATAAHYHHSPVPTSNAAAATYFLPTQMYTAPANVSAANANTFYSQFAAGHHQFAPAAAAPPPPSAHQNHPNSPSIQFTLPPALMQQQFALVAQQYFGQPFQPAASTNSLFAAAAAVQQSNPAAAGLYRFPMHGGQHMAAAPYQFFQFLAPTTVTSQTTTSTTPTIATSSGLVHSLQQSQVVQPGLIASQQQQQQQQQQMRFHHYAPSRNQPSQVIISNTATTTTTAASNEHLDNGAEKAVTLITDQTAVTAELQSQQ